MDWLSRYVLSWALSVTLDGQFCREALLQALHHGKRPEIFNTDQGGQFTRSDFTGLLKHEGIQISMDGRGRALDNVFVERLWRSVKYEEVYLYKRPGSTTGTRGVLYVLQPQTVAPGTGLSDTSCRLCLKGVMRGT